ncbi:MAG: tetratricopeptide repeat protein [Massilibacteroides sp.]|nr:tetratricopeptide repeat protein [Massilibacteroides sp.]
MTQKEINQACLRAFGSLDNKELKHAFDALQILISGCKLFYLQEKLDEIQNTYKNMLRYRVEGAQDPMQEHIYTTIQVQAYELTDLVQRQSLQNESMQCYYSNLRNTLVSPALSFREYCDHLKTNTELNDTDSYEKDLTIIFNQIWTSPPLNFSDSEDIKEIMADLSLPYSIGCQIVSALTLGLQTMFDINKIMLLFDAASHSNDEIRVRAYIGLLTTLYFYKKRIGLYSSINDRLGLLAEDDRFVRTIRTITLRFILARETEKITRKLQDEIIPEILKLNTRINKKTNLGDINPEQLTEGMNPEWMEMLEGSDISKKIEEFSELQQEGADVMHSTFVHLKSFPFFSKLANWFLPFTPFLSLFKDSAGKENTDSILKLLEAAPFMCNSDKFSLFFSVMQLPESHRAMMLGQFSSQAQEMMNQSKEELLNKIDQTATIANQYIQDLYRFYKLHPSHLDFDDIFTLQLDFHNLEILKPYFSDDESLTIIAEYYLRKNYFADALTIYERLANAQKDNPVLFQKTGYCHQMNGNFEKALEDYLHADILSPENKWLTRRIAFCYRALKQPEDALKYYLRYDRLQPDNLAVLSSIGHCYLELKDYNEALKYYYKVDYLNSKNHKTWRPIAWCSFLIGKYDQARNYYRKILEDQPNAQDYLNAGHTEWALQNLKSALEYYKKAVQLEKGDINHFKELFYEDKEDLLVAGIEEAEFPLLLDQLMYSL